MRLIWKLCGLLKGLMVVDGDPPPASHRGAQAPDLRREVSCPHVCENGEGSQAVIIGQAHAHGRSIDLRTLPRDREEDGRVAERAEVIRVVGVLPKVVGIHDQVFSKSLLKSRIELVALAGANGRLQTLATDYVGDNRIGCS